MSAPASHPAAELTLLLAQLSREDQEQVLALARTFVSVRGTAGLPLPFDPTASIGALELDEPGVVDLLRWRLQRGR